VAAGSMTYQGTWLRYRWFGYADGRMQLLERTVYEPTIDPHPDYRENYWIIGNPRNQQAYRQYVFNSTGGWLKSSINYFSSPAQVAAGAQPPMPSFVRQVSLPIPVPVIPPASVGIPFGIPTAMISKIDPLL